jgi:phage-related tail protein
LQKTQNKFGNVPNLVNTNDSENLSVSQGTLLPVMVKAIQELSKKVDSLTSQNEALQNMIYSILRKLD